MEAATSRRQTAAVIPCKLLKQKRLLRLQRPMALFRLRHRRIMLPHVRLRIRNHRLPQKRDLRYLPIRNNRIRAAAGMPMRPRSALKVLNLIIPGKPRMRRMPVIRLSMSSRSHCVPLTANGMSFTHIPVTRSV